MSDRRYSLAFAAALGLLLAAAFFRDAPDRRALAAFFSLAAAALAALDALTNGGLGVALFAPLSGARYFFPFRPVQVSPIGAGAFFSEWGVRVIESELLWVWLPASLAVGLVLAARLAIRARNST